MGYHRGIIGVVCLMILSSQGCGSIREPTVVFEPTYSHLRQARVADASLPNLADASTTHRAMSMHVMDMMVE